LTWMHDIQWSATVPERNEESSFKSTIKVSPTFTTAFGKRHLSVDIE